MTINTNTQNITYATGMVNPKTTALFFDKLWVYPTLVSSGAIPQEICMKDLSDKNNTYFYASARNDLGYAASLVGNYHNSRELIEEAIKSRNKKLANNEKERKLQHKFEYLLRKASTYPEPFTEDFFSPNQPELVKHRNIAIREIVKSYARKNIHITPVYFQSSDYEEITEKEITGLVTCFSLLSTAIEDKLSWKQVIEFRKDKKAREKLVHPGANKW